jgi:hypothetical protein
MKEKEVESKGEDKILASSSRTSTLLFDFIGKKLTSLDSEVDEEQETTKSKRASSLKKR